MPTLSNCTETFCKFQTLQNECIANKEEAKGCPASRQPPRTEGPIREALGSIFDIRSGALAFLSYAITCKINNQPDWMHGFAEQINDLVYILGGDERFFFERDRLIERK